MHLGITNSAPGHLFPDIYEELLWQLLRRGVEERNERTGHAVKSLAHPTSFSLDLDEGLLPLAGNRKLFPATAAAEVAWMLMGTQDPSFIMAHASKVWGKFLEPILDNDKPSYAQGVKAAYGYRWRKHFGRDQIAKAVAALQDSPSDRRVWVSAWDPANDGLGELGQLNVPCPVGFSLSIVNSRLNSSLVLRSSDVFVGLPYDVMGHAMLMAVLAATIRVGLGHMHVTLAHPHIYDSHFAYAEESMMHKHAGKLARIQLYGLTLGDLMTMPEHFVSIYKTRGAAAKWPDFSPKPEVIP